MILKRAQWVSRGMLPILCGGVIALGQAPYSLWWLSVLALSFAIASGVGRGFFWGWRLGLGYFGLSLLWLAEPFFVDAATVWMAPFAVIAMAGGLALFWGAAFVGARWYGAVAGAAVGPAASIVALISLWAAAEWARGVVLTGFAWAHITYVIEGAPLIQWVSLTGTYGFGLILLLSAALPALSVAMGRWMGGGIIAMGVAFGALWIGGESLMGPPSDTQAHVRVIQPNAPQDLKWDPLHYPTFYERALELTQAPAAQPLDLIIWPETSYSPRYMRIEQPFDRIVGAAGNVPILVGFVDVTADGDVYNTAGQFRSAVQPEHLYRKFHLVPFGEYIPWADVLAPFDVFGLAQFGGDFSAGSGPEWVQIDGLGRVQILICYEAVFARNVLRGADRPDVLIHMTNDAWFGTRSGPYQHLAQARVRAIENGLPVIRAANTGVSAGIDPYGRVVTQIPLGHAGLADIRVPHAAPPTFYSQLGNWPFAALLLMCGLALAVYAFGSRFIDRSSKIP